jgi:hypothetical protein
MGAPHPPELAELADARTAEFEPWLTAELQRIVDEAIMHSPEFDSETHLVAPPKEAQLEPAPTPEDPVADQPTSKIPGQKNRQVENDLISANWGQDEWDRAEKAANYYEELGRLQTMAVGDTNEEKLRKEHPDLKIWKELESVPSSKRQELFRRLRAAKADEKAEFVGRLFGNASVVTVKRWKSAWAKRLSSSTPDPAQHF